MSDRRSICSARCASRASSGSCVPRSSPSWRRSRCTWCSSVCSRCRCHTAGSAPFWICRHLMENFDALMHGFSIAISVNHIALMVGGVLLGILVGVLPGLGAPNGVSLLLPLTFGMTPVAAIILLSSIYWGALFGGSVTSILFNIPGEQSSVATTFDGYPMARDGRAAEALTAAFSSALIGALAGVLLLTFLSTRIAAFAMSFSSPEFFAVYLLAFCTFIGM